MLFEESFIQNLLRCQYCLAAYNDHDRPRIMPCCQKNICNKCFNQLENEIINNRFKCVMCSDEQSLPTKGFIINELAVKLVTEQPKKCIDIYRGEKCQILKENLVDLESAKNKFQLEVKNKEDELKEHCANLKRQIKANEEKKQLQLSEISRRLIEQVNTFEREQLENILKFDVLQTSSEFISVQRNYLNQYQIDDTEIESSNERTIGLKSKLDNEIFNFKRVKTCGKKIIKFKTNSASLAENALGQIYYETIESKITRIVIASNQKIKMYNYETGICLRTYEGHEEQVSCVRFTEDNKLISSSEDSTIKIWDIDSGCCLKTLKDDCSVNCIEIWQKNKIISCNSENRIKIWNTETNQCIATLEGHTKDVWCVKLLSENQLFSSSFDFTLKLWDLSVRKCLKTYKGHTKPVYCMDIISKGLMASGSGDNTIKIWSIDTCVDINTLKGHTKSVNCIKVTNDRLKLISGSEDKTVKIWNIDSGVCLKTLLGHTNNVWGLQLIKADLILSTANDGKIKYWNIDSGQCIKTIIDDNEESAIMSIQAF